MKFQMAIMVNLLRKELLPASLLRDRRDDDYITEKATSVLNIINNAKEHLETIFFDRLDDSLERLIPHFQYEINRALNTLYCYTQGKKYDEFIKVSEYSRQTYFAILYTLRSFNTIILKRYRIFLDTTLFIHHYERLCLFENAERALSVIKSRFADADLSQALSTEICRPLNYVLTVSNKVTYVQELYLKNYLEKLLSFVASPDLNAEVVVTFLFTQRFNPDSIFNLYTAWLTESADKLATQNARILFYHQQLKIAKQTCCDAIHSFDDSRPDILTRVKSWIEEEIVFLKHEKELIPIHNGESANNTAGKIKLNFSMYEISVLLQCLIKANLVEDTDVDEVARAIAGNVRTKRSDNVMFNSLRVRQYEFDKNVLTKLVDKILTLINVLRAAKAA